MTTRMKVAECAALHWNGGQLVWDGYLRRQQFALTPTSEAVLRFCARWRGPDELGELLPVAQHLLDAGVLVAEGSPEHAEEQRVLARWQDWGPAARFLHFSARAPRDARFLDLAADHERMVAKATVVPPPEPVKTYTGTPLVPVPTGRPDDAQWPRAAFLEAAYARRSTRTFADEPLPLADLGAILQVAGGFVDIVDDPETGPSTFKTSPSAGARDPIELYVHARDVADLPAGVYHFSPARGGLEAIGPSVDAHRLVAALGGQPWLAAAPALLIYTAVVERVQWRYESRRAYRDVLIGMGHVSQTVLLTASAMGLGAVTATAVSDEALEELLGCDPVAEPVLGVTAIGVPVRP
ncbi:SagB/ThcOx family dehydrogenase [Pseudonocardia sp. CA-107938]|uniref:SagB/ThcOx family dehydrogenase n=1 Tax=Pseudonocardia sp. CA-107938 TaxID=3240021 RepID=UPI003D8CBBDA